MTEKVIANANAHCVGGHADSPDLSAFPLLCWHPDRGAFTEDGRASVLDIAAELAVNPNIEAVAAKFGTTDRHVGQALAYSLNSGIIKGR